MKKMPHDEMEHMDHKMYHKQRRLFRAFFINLVLLVAYWLLVLSPGCMGYMAEMLKMPAELLYIQSIGWLAIWDIAGVVLFLVPAVATYWERCTMKREMK